MSEYQSYEFRAIDQPLDAAARKHLRSLSTRAEITATSFSNVYNWGSFKGNPRELVRRYFDVFVYYANWGTYWCILRLPAGVVAADTLSAYASSDAFGWDESGQHVLLQYRIESEGEYYVEEGGAWIDELAGLRTELLRGDLRPLYLGWLAAVRWGLLEDDTPCPQVPPGLRALSSSQLGLAGFLGIDSDLIEAAAADSADNEPAAEPTREEYLAWLGSLDAADKDAWLADAMAGGGTHLGAELRAAYARAHPREVTLGAAAARTVGALEAAAEAVREKRERREAEAMERKRRAEERRKAELREKHLAALAGRDEELWQRVVSLVRQTQPKPYDEAVALLLDLQDLALRDGRLSEFEERVHQLREDHAKKPSFIERLRKAGL